jgi:hypothetical protein
MRGCMRVKERVGGGRWQRRGEGQRIPPPPAERDPLIPPPCASGIASCSSCMRARCSSCMRAHGRFACVRVCDRERARECLAEQHASAYVSIRQHTRARVPGGTACVSIRQHTPAYARESACRNSMRQHTPAYARESAWRNSMRQHASAYVSIRESAWRNSIRQHTSAYAPGGRCRDRRAQVRPHTPAYASIRQHTSAYVSIRAWRKTSR